LKKDAERKKNRIDNFKLNQLQNKTTKNADLILTDPTESNYSKTIALNEISKFRETNKSN